MFQDFSHIRRHKTQLELVLLSCAVCGIEFCYAAETAFVSPTLLKIGVPVTYMTLIWCLSPIIGFLLTPVLGSLSDRCRSKLGRRRPFIMLFSVGVVLGLLLVPNGETLGVLLGDTYTLQVNGTPSMNNVTVSPPVVTTHSDLVNSSVLHLDVTTERGELINTTSPPEEISHTWSILFTVLGVVMLDFSCDACQSPCRAYLLDVSIPADHHPGLSTFTVMAGLGGSLGYVLGGINWENTGFGESLGGHVRVVFTFVLIIYIICVVLTLTSVREVPLDYLGIPEEHLQKKKTKQEGTKYRKFNNEDSDSEEERETMKHYGSINSTTAQDIKAQEHLNQNHITHHHENNDTPYQGRQNGDHCLAQKTGSPAEVNGGVMNSCTQARPSIAPLPSEVSLKTYLRSIVKIPRSLLVLCLTNLFCWMSLVCYSLYFTDFVGQTVYGGNPSSPPGSPERALYESGVRMGSFGMSLYSLSCAIYSLCIENFVNKFGKLFYSMCIDEKCRIPHTYCGQTSMDIIIKFNEWDNFIVFIHIKCSHCSTFKQRFPH